MDQSFRNTLFELSSPGRRGFMLPANDVPAVEPDARLLRTAELGLPELNEVDVVRHFMRLSQLNFSVDTHFYPLGSCTMKYNPKVNDRLAAHDGFSQLHPYQPDALSQGMLQLLYELERDLCQITGFPAISLQPAAGAHGELLGMMIARKYFDDRNEPERRVILIPDSGHGTNPASAALHGFEVKELTSTSEGLIDIAALKAALDPTVAGIMLTNPNTLGLFEKDILTITHLVHANGSLVYGDGANMNALLGICRPGDMGFDMLHVNLHKTFSTPHGGGGPGAGPVAVTKELAPFLPLPRIRREKDQYTLITAAPHSVGRVRAFFGNVGVLIRAYCYIKRLGASGLRQVSEQAIINANYLRKRLETHYEIAYRDTCMHEFVITACKQAAGGVTALDIAKRLIDCRIHPPTIYFPLIVAEALMIEPTESESPATLDAFVDCMIALTEEAQRDPDSFHAAPLSQCVGRLDEVTAARKPVLRGDGV